MTKTPKSVMAASAVRTWGRVAATASTAIGAMKYQGYTSGDISTAAARA
jgi:hypothetical protein